MSEAPMENLVMPPIGFGGGNMFGEFFSHIKRQNWQLWFRNPEPMLGNVSPVEAAKTPEGRARLEEYFASRENSEGPRSPIEFDIDPTYARWKLGYGPGSEEEFAEEENILNANNYGEKKATNRNPKHQRRLEKSKTAMFIPKRCEIPGCDKQGDDVKKCGRCGLVAYCSREHQESDWQRHKSDCNHLKKSGLKRLYFDPEKELKDYPIGCFPLDYDEYPEDPRCFVCGASEDEVNMGYTDCCNAPICDNEFEYQMMSYSRDFCKRSHMRYTLCGSHYRENHPGDWRKCSECKEPDDQGGRTWYGTNGFNLTPCLEEMIPKGSFITKPCATCSRRITPGHDGETYTRAGACCTVCQPAPTNGRRLFKLR